MNNNGTLVSIIVPIFNVGNYLEKGIASILSQSYTNLEIILVDDGSTDNSSILCDYYAKKDRRIKVIHKSNGGLSDSRNAGLNIASGDFITFIDGDDWYDINAILNMITAFDSSDVGIVYMGMKSIDTDMNTLSFDNYDSNLCHSREFVQKVCNNLVGTSVCSKMFKKEIINGHRFIKNKLNEDFFFLVSLLIEKDTKIKTINYNGYYYLKRIDSLTHSPNRKSLLDSIDNCYELYIISLPSNDKHTLEAIARMALHQSCVSLIVNPDYKLGKNSLFYTKSIESIRRYKKYVLSSHLSNREKIICISSLLFPRLVGYMVNKMYRIKNRND